MSRERTNCVPFIPAFLARSWLDRAVLWNRTIRFESNCSLNGFRRTDVATDKHLGLRGRFSFRLHCVDQFADVTHSNPYLTVGPGRLMLAGTVADAEVDVLHYLKSIATP